MASKDTDRASRARMEDASRHSLGAKIDRAAEQPKVEGYRLRGKLYDKIKVSVHTMDIIIVIVAALLIAALVVGIITGSKT